MDIPEQWSPLISPDDVASLIGHPRLVILDASVGDYRHSPERIPGALAMDIDGEFSDNSSDIPHTMVSAEKFQQAARNLGINNDSLIVIYDAQGIFSSARGWWMFRSMGLDTVAVLDGGLPGWKAAGLSTEISSQKPEDNHVEPQPRGNFQAHYHPEFFVDAATVAQALREEKITVTDARSTDRFLGRIPEPRPGLRRGHMPGAVNIPFLDLQDDNAMRPSTELAKILAPYMEGQDQLIASCGSGVTACVIALGATLAECDNIAVYDGSWSEWGRPGDLPVSTEESH
ncbi:sulfurtransferase [Corynebacterium poyangense]|uniref:Sulfurtransferase n=1 Tax=Corynebacterium poyangense TaxID=2684405 RepID=A0A7H0SPX5_9CORY|nr:sulfurtransferase [Corynebacterium poyangense]MBZ8178475.1 sulfurtransferase [Corynebacterium poyangense]QNQ90600.1 sulfurtransferase [Corynebacterium poyangense]